MANQFTHALVVGHPGHELRAFHWMELHRPVVCVITDGSGQLGVPRTDSTHAVLAAAGATAGPIFAPLADRDLYAALLARDTGRFLALAEALAETLSSAGVLTVAGDAAEGFNPTHDLCRILLDAVVERCATTGRGSIENLAFALDGRPDAIPSGVPADAVTRLDLDAGALSRKLAAARGYPEMRHEVEAAVARFGEASFAVENFWRPAASRGGDADGSGHERPFYERHGESRVAAGMYREAVRAAEHVRPIAQALRRWAGAAP